VGSRPITALLAFIGGFVDTAGFLGFNGLFLSHVTGNLATLCTAIVLGSKGYLGKILVLPEFMIVVALARLAGAGLQTTKAPVGRVMLASEAVLLTVFFALAVSFGPFTNSDSGAALLTAFVGIAAMAVQNTLQQVHMGDQPPTTYMTGNATHAAIAGINLLVEAPGTSTGKFADFARSLLCFAAGCAIAAVLYWYVGLWCLAVPMLLTAAAALMRSSLPEPVARPF
jgi:uncharacterized membrane protein YoaK (UPF0700 family)